MQFHQYLQLLADALQEEDAQNLTLLLKPTGAQVKDLLSGLHDSRVGYVVLRDMMPNFTIHQRPALIKFSNNIVDPWAEIAIAHVQVVISVMEENFVEAYKEQASLLQ